jgi:hypothetical protein
MTERQKGNIYKKSKTGIPASLLVLLMGCGVLAEAQDTGTGNQRSSKGSATLEQKVTVTMPIPSIQFATCEAYISIQSHQRNTLARVVTGIEQKPCATSSGEYELLITVKDENGIHQPLLFNETWEQEDDSPMEFSRDYPIGENVTLKRVMARGVRCECSD